MLTGQEAETLFVRTMENLKKEVVKSSREEDMFKHIDFFVDGESYDVKGEKRLDRAYDDKDATIWIESVNVRGDKGWLFGEAKYIAFLIDKEFWVLKRVDLVNYIEREITCDKVFPIKRYKKWYTREGKKDIVTYVYPRDIERLVINKIKCYA